ncbi:hydroxyisourate hydrolase [Bartonella tamiae]|uniref:5-hydroxyisourate hydrolase n=1 Tax=Bartonella tamiae Th239 TaxID=1094558 RepID=J0R0S8_9HYPH|nr:hydroxyisourate hydrolase [Bartonella tamiae]EJF89129.1 hydroxyisourate hydrolase [Bartonella tamiae Th239]EJF95468.1 hydroxyisourate hydrolase [Bartonella tamiae Th307]
MKKLYLSLVGIFFLLLPITVSTSVLAEDNPLSVHVLNLQSGLPSQNVVVTLEKQEGDSWKKLNEATTNEQGRIGALFPKNEPLTKGMYRVVFKTGDWFKAQKEKTFFPEIPVIFQVDGTLNHYHIPLLLSPFGYSTYRGN